MTTSHSEPPTPMETIERNPDVNLDCEEVPAGMTLVRGKNLHHTARSRKIPFGVCDQANWDRGYVRRETVGLIIRDRDVRQFKAALAAKKAKKPTGRVE